NRAAISEALADAVIGGNKGDEALQPPLEAPQAEPRRRTRQRTAPRTTEVESDSLAGEGGRPDDDWSLGTVQESTVQERAVQGGAVQESTVVQDSTVQESTIREGMVRESTVRDEADAVQVRVERAREPERIIPASPFAVIFQSPDLATDDDDPAPS